MNHVQLSTYELFKENLKSSINSIRRLLEDGGGEENTLDFCKYEVEKLLKISYTASTIYPIEDVTRNLHHAHKFLTLTDEKSSSVFV